MVHRNFKAYLLAGSILVSSSVSPISDKWVIPGTVTSALGGGTAGYYLTRNSSDLTKVLSILAGTVGSGVLANWLLYRFTPQGRYDRAMKIINDVSYDGFLLLDLQAVPNKAVRYDDDGRLMGITDEYEYSRLKWHCKAEYESDWYLVSGKMHLNKLKNDLVWAWSMFDCAQQQAQYSLANQCRDAKQQVEVLKYKVLHLLDLVDSDSTEYHRQRKAYDAYLERLQQEQMHNEDRSDSWSKQRDRRRDKRLDRELKKELHREKMNAKQNNPNSQISPKQDLEESKNLPSRLDWEEVMLNVDFM